MLRKRLAFMLVIVMTFSFTFTIYATELPYEKAVSCYTEVVHTAPNDEVFAISEESYAMARNFMSDLDAIYEKLLENAISLIDALDAPSMSFSSIKLVTYYRVMRSSMVDGVKSEQRLVHCFGRIGTTYIDFRTERSGEVSFNIRVVPYVSETSEWYETYSFAPHFWMPPPCGGISTSGTDVDCHGSYQYVYVTVANPSDLRPPWRAGYRFNCTWHVYRYARWCSMCGVTTRTWEGSGCGLGSITWF